LWTAEELGDNQYVQIVFSAEHVAGADALLVGTGPEDTWAAAKVPVDGKRKKVELWLLRPLGAPVYLGCPGGNRWALQDIRVGLWRPAKLQQLWDAPNVFSPLAADWEPKGLLDARVITVGREQRLSLDVGSVRLVMPASAVCRRGQRDEVKVDAVNTADVEVKLTIGLQGPPWVWLPKITVPIKAHQQIVLRPELTSFWAGEHWVKLVFECGGQLKAAPLRLQCTPAYPAFGAFLAENAKMEELTEALAPSLSLIVAPCPLVEKLGAKRPGPEIMAYGSADELEALAGSEAARWVRIACVWGQAREWSAGIDRIVASPAQANAKWMLAVGPLHVRLCSEGLGGDEVELAQVAACAGKLSALVALAPALPAVEVARVLVDGRPDEAMLFWQDLLTRFDPAPLGAQLAARRLALPIAWVGLSSATDTTPPPQGTAWATASAALLYQGATAVCAQWPAPDHMAWVELMRELTTGVPVVPLCESDIGATSARAPVVYKPFLRGREGSLALCNTSAHQVEVAVELGAEPLEGHLVRLAPGAQPCREHIMPFRFPDEAFKVGRPIVVLRMEPAETTLLTVRFVDAHPGWLRSLERHKPQINAGPRQDFLKYGGPEDLLRSKPTKSPREQTPQRGQ
jgi:hypothetical protein